MLWLFRIEGQHNPNTTLYQFWQQENHPLELNTNLLLDQKLHYLHQNPVRAGLYQTFSGTDGKSVTSAVEAPLQVWVINGEGGYASQVIFDVYMLLAFASPVCPNCRYHGSWPP
jgi:hypothetical protein